MSNYRRHRLAGGCYFFTVNLADRHSHLLIEHIDLLREAVRTVWRSRPFQINAWVVLPEHLHTVWTLPPDDADYSVRWSAIKRSFSRSLPHTESLTPSRAYQHERGIWQRRFWEHTIRNEADYQAHVDYVHINPLRHGWVSTVADWPYSTFHRAVAQGVYPSDWAGTAGAEILVGE